MHSRNEPTGWSNTLSSLGWGLGWEMGFGVVYASVGEVILLALGQGAIVQYHIGPAKAIGLYLGCGLVTGAIVGLLRPLLVNRIGAMAVGLVAAVPVGLSFATAMGGWSPQGRIGAIIWSVVMGP